MLYKILIFAIINFGALGLGAYFMGDAVNSAWYENLNKAPWTPPGWFFGVAWTVIMICFSIWMAYAWENTEQKSILLTLFIVQWILNVSWNPIFFRQHWMVFGLVTIALLTAVVGVLLFRYYSISPYIYLFILPYFIWLIVATSLNAYILVKN